MKSYKEFLEEKIAITKTYALPYLKLIAKEMKTKLETPIKKVNSNGFWTVKYKNGTTLLLKNAINNTKDLGISYIVAIDFGNGYHVLPKSIKKFRDAVTHIKIQENMSSLKKGISLKEMITKIGKNISDVTLGDIEVTDKMILDLNKQMIEKKVKAYKSFNDVIIKDGDDWGEKIIEININLDNSLHIAYNTNTYNNEPFLANNNEKKQYVEDIKNINKYFSLLFKELNIKKRGEIAVYIASKYDSFERVFDISRIN